MAQKPKHAVEAAPRTSASSLAEMVGDWIRQATEGLIATEKILLDLAAQQNALALTIVRERIGLFSPTPSKAAVDLSGRGAHNFFEAQRLLLDMIAKQNSLLADGLKPALAGTAAEGLADVIHRGLDTFLAAQKQYIDIFEDESQGVIKDFGDSKPFDTAHVSTVTREGARKLLDSQRKFLTIVEEELVNGKIKAAKQGDKRRVDLFEVAKQSVDAFVETQKHMLDLATDQINLNAKIAREFVNPERAKTTNFPDLIKKSVDSFVAAQKALIELASKPRRVPAEPSMKHQHEAVGASV